MLHTLLEIQQGQRNAYSKGSHYYRASTLWRNLGPGKRSAGNKPTASLLLSVPINNITQIDGEGRQIAVGGSPYIWLDPSLLEEISNVPSSDLLPSIRTPLSQSSFPICRLLSLCKVALQYNFISAVLTIGGGLMKLHYRKVVEVRNIGSISLKCDHDYFVTALFWMSSCCMQWAC
jgi:hypothetical protein